MASIFRITVLATVIFSVTFRLGQAEIDLDPVLSFVKLRISEFPPISNSSINARSLAVFNNTQSLASLELSLNSLTLTSSKLYIEVRPSSIFEFISFLNLTSSYIESLLWTPCVMLHWPEIITVAEAESIVLLIVGEIEKDDFPLDSEIFVAFEIKGTKWESNTTNIASFEVVLCDLFKYKKEITSTSQFCHIRYLDKPLSVSEGYFSYQPVSTRRRDFNGTVLNIVAQYDPSYEERLVLREFGNGSVEFTKGMCLDLLIALQIAMNFSYVPMKGNGWMGHYPNGTWTGMATQLVYKEADLSIAQASMIMMINDLSAISFLHVSSLGQFVAIFKQPTSSVNLTLFVFSKKSWLVYFLTWIVILASARFAYFIQKRLYHNNINFSSADYEFIRELFSWAVTTLCTRGWYIHPSNLCFRAICLVASATAFCTYAAYSSQLTVILVTEVLPIKTFSELSRSSLEIFTDKWLPVARHLIEKVYNQRGLSAPTENTKTVDDGLQEVITKDSSLAFVTFVDSIPSNYYKMNLSDNFFCETISSVTLASQRTPTAMFLKRGSPLKEILNYNV